MMVYSLRLDMDLKFLFQHLCHVRILKPILFDSVHAKHEKRDEQSELVDSCIEDLMKIGK